MVTEILVAVLAVVILYYMYIIFYNPKKGLWKNQGIPEISNNIVSVMYSSYKKTMHDLQDESYKTHGRVYGTFQFGIPVLMVSDPELLKTIFVKDFNSFPNRADKGAFNINDELFENMLSLMEGEQWKRVRSVISPTFTSGKMKKMSHLIDKCVSSLIKNFESNQNKTINMKEYFGAYTMDVIARCAFGITLDSLNDPNNPFVKHASETFKPSMNWKFLLIVFLPKIIMKHINFSIFPKDSTDFFRSAIKKIISERKLEKDKTHDDFLQLMIEASEKDSDGSSKTLSDIEIIANAFIFFVAGYETTTNALSFIAYNLAMNPEVQKSLQKEVDAVVDKPQDTSTYETVMNLPYLEAVISENLRTHTNLIRLDRIAARDYTLNNIHIPKGTIIGIPSGSMHKDKEFFPEPDKFKPERFLPENKDDIKPYTYLPFGSGPRNCIAMRFALMEVKYAIFKVVQNFEFVATKEAKAGLEFNHFSQLLQSKKVPLQVVKRRP